MAKALAVVRWASDMCIKRRAELELRPGGAGEHSASG